MTLLFFAVCLICYAHACTGVPCAHTCCGSATYGSEYYHNHSYRSLKLPGADVARAFNAFTSRLHIDGVVAANIIAHTHTCIKASRTKSRRNGPGPGPDPDLGSSGLCLQKSSLRSHQRIVVSCARPPLAHARSLSQHLTHACKCN